MKKENLNRAVQLKEELGELHELLEAMKKDNNYKWEIDTGLHLVESISYRTHEKFINAIEESINEINKEIEEL